MTAPPPDWLVEVIRDVPDFPREGILFKDLGGLWASPSAMSRCAIAIAQLAGEGITAVAGIEARGFLAGLPVASRLGLPFVPVRKPGKLPPPIATVAYALEYGSDSLELQTDALGDDDRVVIVDDVLATGGTAAAAVELVGRTGAEVVSVCTILELGFLDGRAVVEKTGTEVHTLWEVL